jgi:hypothetical protein
LAFAGGREHVDIKTGLSRWGPASLEMDSHPSEISIGFIGSALSVAAAKRLLQTTSQGVPGDPQARDLPDFPGCARDRGFFSDLLWSDRLTRTITRHELTNLKQTHRLLSSRFDAAVALIGEDIRLLAQQEQPPKVIVVALPEELELLARVKVRDKEKGDRVRNLRRALKVEAMRHKVPIQIIRQRTSLAESRSLDHPSRLAWNLFTGLFYKGGGTPWKPKGLDADTCYIGIAFHRLPGKGANVRTSVAQAFDEQGVGLVLRGPDFQWDDERYGRSPHLDAEVARDLLSLVLKRYSDETNRPAPGRVVIHKTSRYWPDEREGIQAALKGIRAFDLVAVSPTSAVRLFRAGMYPPLRGTFFSVGDLRYLYTTGYIHALEAYPHGHVPAPLQISDHYGDSSIEAVAKEIMVLTKMNWNSAGFAGASPVTVRFSQRVGDILKELPEGVEPHPLFKFYT